MVNRKFFGRILISLIVVTMVGGTFFYLFQTRDLKKTVLGGFLSTMLVDLIQEKEPDQKIIPEIRENDEEEYKETALSGDGLTHIARRALSRHIEKEEIIDLTSEHKIYIEDYVQKKLGSGMLSLGEEVNVSQDLISEAINSSRKLTDQQLNNLKQYSLLVSFL